MPSWKILDTFVYSTLQSALEEDVDDTIPLTHDEIDPIIVFDPVLLDISTKKGIIMFFFTYILKYNIFNVTKLAASILRMIENSISEKNFKQAIINFIKEK